MLSLDELTSREWAAYGLACKQQEEAFAVHVSHARPKDAFSRAAAAKRPLLVLARIQSSPRATVKAFEDAASWLWLNPLSSEQDIMQANRLSASDAQRLVSGCDAKAFERQDGTAGYFVSDRYSPTNMIDSQAEERICSALRNAGEGTEEQLIFWLFGRKGSVSKCLTIMESTGQVKNIGSKENPVYCLDANFDSSAPHHAKMTPSQKVNLVAANKASKGKKKSGTGKKLRYTSKR